MKLNQPSGISPKLNSFWICMAAIPLVFVAAGVTIAVQTLNHREAISDTRVKAEQGEANAQYKLGQLYLCRGGPRDVVEALYWLEQAQAAPNPKISRRAAITKNLLTGRSKRMKKLVFRQAC